MTAELGSIPGLREAMEARDVYIVGTDDDVLFGLVEAAIMHAEFSAMDDALARFDFGESA